MKPENIALTASLILGLVQGVVGDAQAQTVGIATSNPGSLFHNIGSAVAKLANKNGLRSTVQPSTSPNQYLPLINANEIEFGIGNLQEFNYALEGKKWFSGSVNSNLRVVGLIMPLRVAIFVRAESDIKTMADLKGRRMADGYTAQRTVLPQLDALYATAGITRDDIKPVHAASAVAGAHAFMSGEAEGFVFAHGAGKVREADAAVGGLRALPIENTEENLKLIREFWPVGYLTRIEPGPATPGVLEEGWFIAYPQLVFTNADVPEDVIYQMAKILYEGQKGMADVFPAFHGFKPDDHMVRDTSPGEYHPGAIRFFREKGLWKE